MVCIFILAFNTSEPEKYLEHACKIKSAGSSDNDSVCQSAVFQVE